jgi:NodT family efflux transporter outer membrane factor (OMF) lipoprotein
MNYIDVRSYQARIAAAEGNVARQAETYQLTLWRQQAGLGDELAVQEALSNLENTRSQVPDLRSGLEAALNRIAVLLGEQPGKVHKELEKPASIPAPPVDVAVGVPADMLRRRPDVRRAERELAAQTARVGVATAELYPKFTLTGSIGIEALSVNRLVSTPTRSYSFGPSISWPIFKGGAIRANIEVQSALQEQALVEYEKTVLSALEEVENVLTAYAEEQNKMESLRLAERAANRSAEVALLKYEAGLSDFLAVLVAQRSLLSAQDQLAKSRGVVTSNLIKLYKALGGGWESMASREEERAGTGKAHENED